MPEPSFPNPEYDAARHAERVRRWQEAGNDERLRTNYALDPASVVLDLGGFHGDFAVRMNDKYGSICHVFEVVPELCELIRRRVHGNPKITVHDFGLARETREVALFLADEGSSIFADRVACGRSIVVRLVRAADWFAAHLGGAMVDLMKINTEGGEYDLLEHMLEENLVARVRNIQVQFHEDVVAGAARRMEAIQDRLSHTHRLTYQERFVWENWELRG
jgi:FkbM family methyltransferase